LSDKLELMKSRAARAKALADDDLLKEAFATLEAEYIKAWKEQFHARDTDARERMWHAVQVIGKVQQHLHTVIDKGKVADKQLAELVGEKKLAIV
jgi:hypothetical protein